MKTVSAEQNKTVPLHIEILKQQFQLRQALNPKYSLRAFAYQLAIHPSVLGRILSEKQYLSANACAAIVTKLALTEVERQKFIDSFVEDRTARLSEHLHEVTNTSRETERESFSRKSGLIIYGFRRNATPPTTDRRPS